MKSGAQKVHLLLECVGPAHEKERTASGGGGDAIPIDPLEIQSGVNYIVQERGERPRLLSTAPKRREGLFALQQVTQNGTPYLLLLSTGERQAWVNGNVAPSVTLLADRDEVQFDRHGEFVVHVTVFDKIYIGAVPERELGRECRFCRLAFVPETRVYICSSCGKALHLEADEKPEEERLQCALLCSVCPTCETPILKTSGYRSLPEFCNPRADRSLA